MEFIESYLRMLDLLKRVMPDNKEIAKEINLEVMIATASIEIMFDRATDLRIVSRLKSIFLLVEKTQNEQKKLEYLDLIIESLKDK